MWGLCAVPAEPPGCREAVSPHGSNRGRCSRRIPSEPAAQRWPALRSSWWPGTKPPASRRSFRPPNGPWDILRAEVIPQRKWFDFETFFSCSRKAPGFHDPFTLQFAQNTLVMDQAAAACARLARVTGEKNYRDLGTAVLDYLLLYQQVWSPAWLSRALFGGFGVQNTDGEWSDARQGYFAMTLSDYLRTHRGTRIPGTLGGRSQGDVLPLRIRGVTANR